MQIATTSAAVAALSLLAAHAQAQEKERLPKLGISMSEKPDGAAPVEGPLFKRVKAALAAAERGDDAGFAAFFTPTAKPRFGHFPEGSKLAHIPFDVAFVRALAASCLAPQAYDEAVTWVQISWVCRTEDEAPIRKFTRFRYNPELVATVRFEGDKISNIDALETLMVPGQPRYRMDAYSALSVSAFLGRKPE